MEELHDGNSVLLYPHNRSLRWNFNSAFWQPNGLVRSQNYSIAFTEGFPHLVAVISNKVEGEDEYHTLIDVLGDRHPAHRMSWGTAHDTAQLRLERTPWKMEVLPADRRIEILRAHPDRIGDHRWLRVVLKYEAPDFNKKPTQEALPI